MSDKGSNNKREAEYAFVPERIEWLPGDTPVCMMAYPEATWADYFALMGLFKQAKLKVVDDVFKRWMSQHGYVVRLVRRNGRNNIGFSVSRHTPGKNRILAWYIAPSYRRFPIFQRLITLAQLELPEAPTTVPVALTGDSETTQNILRSCGWKATKTNDAESYILFRSAPLLKFGGGGKAGSD